MENCEEEGDLTSVVHDGMLDLSSRDLLTLPSQIGNGIGPQITHLILDFNEISELPTTFGNYCINLEILSLVGNQLKELPDSIGTLCHLRKLHLNENNLKCLPDSICEIKRLEVLKLTGNNIHNLPNNLGEVSSLKILNSDENKLVKLPCTLGLLENLEILELCDNVLMSVPVGIGKMNSLKIVNLSNNKLETLPDSFGDLEKLETVDISGNHLEKLPSHFVSAKSVINFCADRNRFVDIPDWVSDMGEAVEISLNDNQFHKQAMNEKMGYTCKKLKLLDLSGNFIEKLPDSFGKMENLVTLRLGSCIGELERRAFQNGNWLTYLPSSFCDLVNLTTLYLDENLLQELPESFGNLVSLEFIDLGQNALHELPDSFCDLKSLKICQLSRNKIQFLPPSFGSLSGLEDLRLDNNLLEELPESFKCLTGLKSLDLFNNKLTEVPTALTHFKKLVRLDLSENCFKIPWDEVPQIIRQSHYPPRDPELKNNWRGRARQDLSMMEDQIIKIDKTTEELDFEPPPKDLGFNEDALRNAAEQGMSFWRSHIGSGKREKFVHHNYRLSGGRTFQNCSEDEESESTEDCNSEDDEDFEPPIFQPKRHDEDVTSSMNEGYEASIGETENWDNELEDVTDPFYKQYDDNYFNDIYVHPRPKTLEEVGYVVDDHLCLPYDIHSQPIIKQRTNFTVEVGQFDDAVNSS